VRNVNSRSPEESGSGVWIPGIHSQSGDVTCRWKRNFKLGPLLPCNPSNLTPHDGSTVFIRESARKECMHWAQSRLPIWPLSAPPADSCIPLSIGCIACIAFRLPDNRVRSGPFPDSPSSSKLDISCYGPSNHGRISRPISPQPSFGLLVRVASIALNHFGVTASVSARFQASAHFGTIPVGTLFH